MASGRENTNDPAEAVGDAHIGDAVARHVGAGDGARLLPRRVGLPAEAEGAVSQQYGDARGELVRDDEVGFAVAIEVGDGQRRGELPDVERGRWREAPGAVPATTTTVLLVLHATARSRAPLPLKSATASAAGQGPVATGAAEAKPPRQFPRIRKLWQSRRLPPIDHSGRRR